MKRFDLAVIGSGQGGVPLALDLARAGRSVVLFERGPLGGTCVNIGCTPSKAFLASAHAAGRARHAARLGVHADVRVDFPVVMSRVRAIVGEWNAGVEQKLAQSEVVLVRAEAAFVGPHVLAAAGEDYACETIVIDTGTAPAIPPIDGLSGAPYRTNADVFALERLPARTIVFGAGYIGLELGQGLARCGSAVHLVDPAPRLLAGEEPDVSEALAAALAADGIAFHLGAAARRVEVESDGSVTVTLAEGSVLAGELLLVAAGRRPNIPPGAVERGGIALDDRGYVDVDAHLRTNVEGIFALGDVAGQPQFTHVSWEDYRRVMATLTDGAERRRSDRVLGYAIFTDPQVGRVGLTLAQAQDRGHDARAVTLSFTGLARALEWGETNGFFRLVVDADDAILGATFVGYEAGELVHVVLAHMEARSSWRTLERSVHIHPTYAEGLPTLARMLL